MRNIVIIIMILIVVGCARRQDYNPRLLSIEQNVSKNPTASLQNLENSQSAVQTKADSMLYVLLYSEAARAMGMTFTNENWISPTVEFFDKVGDKERTVRSMLMIALCYYDKGEYDKSASWLMKTRKRDDGENPSLCYQLYLTLGDINNIVGRQTEKVNDYRSAYDAAVTARDIDKQITSLYRLAVAYFKSSQKDSLKNVVDGLKRISSKSEADKSVVHTTEGMSCLLNKDTTGAFNHFVSARSNDIDFRATAFSADILYNEGNKQEADNLWLIAANSPDRDIAIYALSHLIDNVEPMAYKFELSQWLNRLYAGKPSAEETAKVIEVQKQFDEIESDERSHHKILVLSIIVGTLIFVIVLIALVKFRQNRQQKEEELSWDIERELLSSDTAQCLHGMASKGHKATADELKQLDNLISTHDPHLRSLLLKSKGLSASDRFIVQLIRLRFQPSEIAVLMDMSPQRVTNARSRLLLRLFNIKGGAKEFDKRIREL